MHLKGEAMRREICIDDDDDDDDDDEVQVQKKPSVLAGVSIVGLCFLYIISPIDLMPEALLGPFGLVDDFGALFLAIKTIKGTFFAPKA
jgi:uncharacterized membrane protein YkvA (DUF1232 family)